MTESKHLRSLQRMLRESIGELAPHCNLITLLLLAILRERTISMPWISQTLASGPLPESNRTRIRRFLDNARVSSLAYAKVIAAFLPPQPWILALDRTNWFWGKTPINLLVLAVVFNKCAVPILWLPLEHPGNSDTKLRIKILSLFLQLFGSKKILYVTGDREFIGKDWLAWLKTNKIPFRLRLKNDTLVLDERGRFWEVSALFKRANRCRAGVFLLWGTSVYLGGKPLGEGKWLVIASSHPGDLLEDYRRRWEIECLFQALKGRGFDLECTRIVQPHRLCALLGILALAYLLCVRAGQMVAEQVGATTGRLRQSIFRRGLERLHRVAIAFSYSPSEREWRDFYQAFTPAKR